jgi:DNA polymerase III epsilon subunit-like protein
MDYCVPNEFFIEMTGRKARLGLEGFGAISKFRKALFRPQVPFRLVALDVETANNDRGSICQIGVACVQSDNSIETWVTYVDPQTSRWGFAGLHGISNTIVAGRRL